MQQTRVIGFLIIVLVLITAIGYVMYQAHSNRNAEQPVKIVIQQEDFDQTRLMMKTPQTAEKPAANSSDASTASASDDMNTHSSVSPNGSAVPSTTSQLNNSRRSASTSANTASQTNQVSPSASATTPTQNSRTSTTIRSLMQIQTPKPDNGPAVNASTLAWAVQVASLSDNGNAKKLVNQLKQAGFAVFTRQKNSNGTVFTQVFLGPELDKDKAQDLIWQLKNRFKIAGVLVSYKP